MVFEKYAIYLGTVIVSILKNSNDNDELFFHIINTGMSKNSIDKKIINTIAWWIPIKKWRDNFRDKFAITRPDQTRPDQTRPDQTRPDLIIPYVSIIYAFIIIQNTKKYNLCCNTKLQHRFFIIL